MILLLQYTIIFASVLMLVAYFAVAAYRIFLLVQQKSVMWFALSHSIEYGIVGIALFLCFYKLGDRKLGFSFALAKRPSVSISDSVSSRF